MDKSFLVHCPALPLKYENLVCRVATHYNFRCVLKLPADASTNLQQPADMLVMYEVPPGDWLPTLDANYATLDKNGAVVVTGINKSAAHSAQWKAIHTDARVRLSIDVYHLGLLFFREEFKEKQHFVLKY